MKKLNLSMGILLLCFFISACGSENPSAPRFTVGGVVTGLTGTMALQNNGSDNLSIKANGPFTFSTAIDPGGAYKVTVRTNPATQTCIVSNGTGTVFLASVTNVSVDCSARGALDQAFNSPKGFVVHNNAAGGNGDDFGNAVAIDSLGRVVVAGSSTNSAVNRDMVVWRYNADGTLDTTFNGTGFVVLDSPEGAAGDDSAHAIAIDLMGGILVTGTTTSTGGNTQMALWQFTPDGTGHKIVSAPVGTGNESGNAIAIDSSARILVTGSTTTTDGTTDMVVWRFNSSGSVDTDFNRSGHFVYNGAAVGSGNNAGNAIAVDSSGKILVAGSSTNSTGNTDMAVWRLTETYALDSGPSVTTNVFVHNGAAGGIGDDTGNAIAIDSQGKIVVAGSSVNWYGDLDMVIWRIKADGSGLDPSFNPSVIINNGASGSNGDDSGRGMLIDPQGRIVVTGTSEDNTGATDMVVWRYNSNGSLDTTFATLGIAVFSGTAGGAGDDSGNAIAIDSHDSQRNIVVAGSSKNSSGNADMVIWRLHP